MSRKISGAESNDVMLCHLFVISFVSSKKGFYLGLQPILNPLLILHYFVCVEVSLLCSLPTMVCAMVGSQVIVSLLCSLPVPILFQIFLIYLNSEWIHLNFIEFLSEKRGHMKKVLSQIICQLPLSHNWSPIHILACLYIWHVCIYYVSSIHHLWKKKGCNDWMCH